MTVDQETIARFEPFFEQVDGRAREFEQIGRIPDDLAEALAREKILKLLVPRQYDGLESHASTFVELLIEASRADAAVGWFIMIANTTSSLSATLPDDWARTMYEDDAKAITVGVAAPYGRGVREGDGLRISGRWPFGSGSHNARWILGGSMIAEDDTGPAEVVAAFFDADDVTIHDNWDVAGLCGTGSNDIEVKDVFVPAGRWAVIGGKPRIGTPLYRFPTLGLLALGVCAVSLGIAVRAIEEFTALATEKVPTGSKRSLAAREAAQKDLAMAEARVGAARAYVHSCINEAWSVAADAGRIPLDAKAKLRLAAANATWSAVDAVDRLYHAAGGTSIYQNSRLQKCFRDVHVSTQHAMVGQQMFEVVGKVMLGIDPKTAL